GPADLAHRLGQGAVLEDAPQEMDAAVAHEELAAELQPHLRLHASGDYALVSILKCRRPPRSMRRRSGADGDMPSERSTRHVGSNPTVPRASACSGGHRMRFVKALAVAVAVVMFGASGASAQEVILSVAISLKEATEELGRTFMAAHPGVTLRYNFGASGDLQKQIEAGAPLGGFLSAAPRPMNDPQKANVIRAAGRPRLPRRRH